MNIRLQARTIRYLRPTQVINQVKCRLKKSKYVAYDSSDFRVQAIGLKVDPIPKNKSCEGNVFTFLNLEHEFSGWNFTGNGMLWAYNQNYFDWINQEGFTAEEGSKWIDKFIAEVKGGFPMDPYPIALRNINWVKFFCRHLECATKERLDSLYSQVKLLEKKLEYHLLGNHLLEDIYALFIVGSYFGDEKLLKRSSKLLLGQLKEQILPDGAHYEQSPMYHCILLDRLLDVINIAKNDVKCQKEDVRCLSNYAERMLGHLESIVWEDGSIPMVNDSAMGIAPTPKQIFDYAKRLELAWNAIPMKECGYRKFKDKQLEAIVDVGNITATYQPGHTHADTFNYELRIDGKPIVVDTGISTYNKNRRRQLERSTIAHNTVSVDGKNSSEVWDGFRVGRRCKVKCKTEDVKCIEAEHDGFKKQCTRRFELKDDSFIVVDKYDGEAVSYIHLAEGADEKRIITEGADKIEIKPWKYSIEYNKFHDGKIVEVHFSGILMTQISTK